MSEALGGHDSPVSAPDRRWLGLVFISLAVAMVIVDVTVINVAIPVIVADLRVDATSAQWIQEAYSLTLAALLLSAGRLADRLGRRRLLVLGVTAFAAGSVLAALAPSGTVLIVARVVQGIGGAAVLPTTLSLINATFRGPERATAFAIWGSVIGAVAAVGPLVGGWLTTALSWHWAFWVNLLVAAVTVLGLTACVTETSEDSEAGDETGDAGAGGARGVDGVGLVLSAVACAAVVFALTEGRTDGWWTALGPERATLPLGLSPVPWCVLLAVLAIGAFFGWQVRRRRAGRAVVLDVALLRIRTFARGNIVVFVVALGQLGLLFVLPLWLQNVLGFSPLGAGLMITAVAVGAFAAAAVTPVLAMRSGTVAVLRLGLVAEIGALAVLAWVAAPSTSTVTIVAILVVYGFGVGTADAQLPGLLLADVPPAQSGQAAGAQSTAQEIGSAMGVAVLGTVLLSALAVHLRDGLAQLGAGAGDAAAALRDVPGTAGGSIPTLSPGLRELAGTAFSLAVRDVALVGAAFLVLGLLATAVVARPVAERTADTVTAERTP